MDYQYVQSDAGKTRMHWSAAPTLRNRKAPPLSSTEFREIFLPRLAKN